MIAARELEGSSGSYGVQVDDQFAVVVFVLPSGEVVLQRRTDDAPYAPGLLGCFGGAIEGDESPDDAVRREIGEETSLDPRDLQLTKRDVVVVPASDDHPATRALHVYVCPIPAADFEVYEGVAAEVHAPDDLETRDDVAVPVGATLRAALGRRPSSR